MCLFVKTFSSTNSFRLILSYLFPIKIVGNILMKVRIYMTDDLSFAKHYSVSERIFQSILPGSGRFQRASFAGWSLEEYLKQHRKVY